MNVKQQQPAFRKSCACGVPSTGKLPNGACSAHEANANTRDFVEFRDWIVSSLLACLLSLLVACAEIIHCHVCLAFAVFVSQTYCVVSGLSQIEVSKSYLFLFIELNCLTGGDPRKARALWGACGVVRQNPSLEFRFRSSWQSRLCLLWLFCLL